MVELHPRFWAVNRSVASAGLAGRGRRYSVSTIEQLPSEAPGKPGQRGTAGEAKAEPKRETGNVRGMESCRRVLNLE